MIIILICLLAPALLINLALRQPFLDKIGLVLLAFGGGMLLSAIAAPVVDYDHSGIKDSLTTVSEICVALAIPLLLFSVDLRAIFTQAKHMLLSMVIAVVTICLSFSLSSFWFLNDIEAVWNTAGMAIGAYTGGGPNMAAIKTAIGADESAYLSMVSYDILLSAIYLILMLSIAKYFFGWLLPAYGGNTASQANEKIGDGSKAAHEQFQSEGAESFRLLVDKRYLKPSMLAFVVALVCVAFSVTATGLFPESIQSIMTIVLITTTGILVSLIERIRRLPSSFAIGNYMILCFCFAIGALTDLSIFQDLNWSLFNFIGISLLGGIAMHALIARLLQIDADTFMMTSAAAILSVPFIPAIAGSLRNKALIAPGFSIAILGYIVGSYLGISMAIILESMLPAS